MVGIDAALIPETIEDKLADTIQYAVEKHCITDVHPNDPSRADVVIVGKPTRELRQNIVLSVHTDHPFGPTQGDYDLDVSGLGKSYGKRPYSFPLETFGGARTEEIIGCVQVNIREKIPVVTAKKLIGAVIIRIKQAINTDPSLRLLEDDFGRVCPHVETFQAPGYTSGGGRTTVHFRWVDWRAYVHTDNRRLEE